MSMRFGEMSAIERAESADDLEDKISSLIDTYGVEEVEQALRELKGKTNEENDREQGSDTLH